MKDQELENLIKETLKVEARPSRDSLSYTLSRLETTNVTEIEKVRYNMWTTKSNIISNRITDVINIWRSRRLVLVPSLIILLLVTTFSLSSHSVKTDLSLEQLVAQDELLEDPSADINGDYDDQSILTSFDDNAINDLSDIENGI